MKRGLKFGIQGNFCNIVQIIYDKFISNIKINSENLSFPLKIMKETRVCILH